jgi:hypothetical protein
MPESLTIDTFLPRVGDVFRVVVSDTHELVVKLSEIARLPGQSAGPNPRLPFSLVFHSLPGSYIPQQIYRMENPAMDPFECFLVPIGPDEHGMRFEAVYT